jgi:hypothetical protein
MLPIGRHDGILLRERLHRAHRDRLLADIEVEKAADLAEAVELRRLFLEAADAEHLPQQSQGMRTVNRETHGHSIGDKSSSPSAFSRQLSPEAER